MKKLLLMLLLLCTSFLGAWADTELWKDNTITSVDKSWFAITGSWDQETSSSATLDGQVVKVHIDSQKDAQWRAQVKLSTQGLTLDAAKRYVFSCTISSTNQFGGTTFKFFDETGLYYANQSITLPARSSIYNSALFTGGDGDGIVVFDFGYAPANTDITISNFSLKEISDYTLPTGYTQVWEDDFSTNTLGTNWNIQEGNGGWGNAELQNYTNDSKNVKIEDGNLVITAIRESSNGSNFTSARINTENKVHFTHGIVEARIKFPSLANGLWPAFWMLGNDINAGHP